MFFDTYSEMLNDTIDGLKREDIQKLFDLIEETRNNGKHLFVLGNGGSAAAASHWVCDFGKGINRGDSKRLKIFSPADNGAIFSALGNDCGYETTFVEQMKNFLEPGDPGINLFCFRKLIKSCGSSSVRKRDWCKNSLCCCG